MLNYYVIEGIILGLYIGIMKKQMIFSVQGLGFRLMKQTTLLIHQGLCAQPSSTIELMHK